jgi:hypothetical protein
LLPAARLIADLPSLRAIPAASQSLPPLGTASPRLQEMHINVVPDGSDTCGGTAVYPPGTDPTLVVNYAEIVDAFSHIPYPGLWASLGFGGSVATALSYDWLFQRIRDPFNVNCLRSGTNSVGCSGFDGQTPVSGGYIDLCDCVDRTVVLHEIGHVIDNRGIQAKISPFYYFNPNPSPGSNSYDEYYRIFNDFSETRTDADGIMVGFVSEYSYTGLIRSAENFAEHFSHYVYAGDTFRAKANSQFSQFGSNLLWEKYFYVSHLFFGIHFAGYGQIGGFDGFPA